MLLNNHPALGIKIRQWSPATAIKTDIHDRWILIRVLSARLTSLSRLTSSRAVPRYAAVSVFWHPRAQLQHSSKGNKRIKASHQDHTNFLQNLRISEDGKMAPCERIAKDELPHLAPFHPGFGQAEQKAVHTCSMVIRQVEELKLAGFRNEEIENICNNNLKPLLVLQNSYPAVNTLALLGPAGVGKSSLICSLLLRPGVAPESGSAERGTSLVHEYVQARLDQTSVYRVAARYLQVSI